MAKHGYKAENHAEDRNEKGYHHLKPGNLMIINTAEAK